ncbi:MAG: hypothetical protein H6Q41_1635 [Deltaproteobacteria bacterium]|nr:hypothetical protein [Deltaproteobacteria bacterium]
MPGKSSGLNVLSTSEPEFSFFRPFLNVFSHSSKRPIVPHDCSRCSQFFQPWNCSITEVTVSAMKCARREEPCQRRCGDLCRNRIGNRAIQMSLRATRGYRESPQKRFQWQASVPVFLQHQPAAPRFGDCCRATSSHFHQISISHSRDEKRSTSV